MNYPKPTLTIHDYFGTEHQIRVLRLDLAAGRVLCELPAGEHWIPAGVLDDSLTEDQERDLIPLLHPAPAADSDAGPDLLSMLAEARRATFRVIQ